MKKTRGRKQQDQYQTSIAAVPERQGLLSDDLTLYHHSQSTGNQDLASEVSKKDVLKEVASIERPQHRSQLSAYWYDWPRSQTALVRLTVDNVIPIYRLYVGFILRFIYSKGNRPN